MVELNINLSKQDYPVFDIEKSNTLHLKSTNFIFGKNGRGKTTLTNLIKNQFEDKYDVRVFTGFENVIKNEKLNAVILGENNIKMQREIEKVEVDLQENDKQLLSVERELASLDNDTDFIETGITKHQLLISSQEDLTVLRAHEDRLKNYFKEKAKEIKEMTNPRIAKTNYDRTNFEYEISKAKLLDRSEVTILANILSSEIKEELPTKKVTSLDLQELHEKVNNLLKFKLKEKIVIKELDTPNKKLFAESGHEIHEIGDSCSFCGNLVNEERMIKLEKYFSADETNNLRSDIKKMKVEIETIYKTKLNDFKLDTNIFFKHLHEKVNSHNILLEEQQKMLNTFLDGITAQLERKHENPFEIYKLENKQIHISYNEIIFSVNELIEEHNQFLKNIEKQREKAFDKLRLHYISEKIQQTTGYKNDWKGYNVENIELNSKTEIYKKTNSMLNERIQELVGKEKDDDETLFGLKNKKEILIKKKQEYLNQTKSSFKLVDDINEKLKANGKDNLELCLVEDDENIEHYQIEGEHGIRGIDKMSTGERNIISFLYFMGSLSDISTRTNKPKIIIMDDPMNSNDDMMQYLIITEIQKLYRGNLDKKSYDKNEDIFVCLTHSAHFYLNVQPHGNYKETIAFDENGKEVTRSKYDKNNFYRIENKTFNKITDSTADFGTHYSLLWIELKELFENDLINSMLNSMRRIIETYSKFNKIHPNKFYKGNESAEKLFNVNSHAIDDLSVDLVGQTKESLIETFEILFKSNNADKHFDSYWK